MNEKLVKRIPQICPRTQKSIVSEPQPAPSLTPDLLFGMMLSSQEEPTAHISQLQCLYQARVAETSGLYFLRLDCTSSG